jgi:hypothetical protein
VGSEPETTYRPAVTDRHTRTTQSAALES